MGNQVKKEINQARLNRIIYSGWDFQQALSSLTFLMEEYDPNIEYTSVELRRLRCYETSTIISFCRPLEASRNKSTLNLKEIGFKMTPEEKRLQAKMMLLRRKIIAHSDEGEMHFRSSTFQIDLPDEKMNIPHAQFEESLYLSEEDFWHIEDFLRKLIHAIAKYKIDLAQEYPELLNIYNSPKTIKNNHKQIQLFYELLKEGKGQLVFNPWVDVDSENDVDNIAPEIRLLNLKKYLNERTNAEYLLLAEALGYNGGHFTGIPMTSERMILGKKTDEDILPSHVCHVGLTRTSKPKDHKNGFNEPTATIVWQKLITEKLDTRNFVFWNAFPWHPYKNSAKILSNRTPTVSEIKEGEAVLKALLNSFKFKKIIALGNKAESICKKLGIKADKVRHPARGGAELFREQFLQIIKG